MAYRDNWLRHLMAPFAGEGLSRALARDFWPSEENLWSCEHDVRWRWFKLLWVYAASVVCQLTTAGLLLVAVIDLFFKPVPLKWWVIAVGGGTAAMLLFAVLVATAAWLDIWRVRRHRKAK